MSSLINLIVCLYMGILVGKPCEESSTAQNQFQSPPIEVIAQLEKHQQILEC